MNLFVLFFVCTMMIASSSGQQAEQRKLRGGGGGRVDSDLVETSTGKPLGDEQTNDPSNGPSSKEKKTRNLQQHLYYCGNGNRGNGLCMDRRLRCDWDGICRWPFFNHVPQESIVEEPFVEEVPPEVLPKNRNMGENCKYFSSVPVYGPWQSDENTCKVGLTCNCNLCGEGGCDWIYNHSSCYCARY